MIKEFLKPNNPEQSPQQDQKRPRWTSNLMILAFILFFGGPTLGYFVMLSGEDDPAGIIQFGTGIIIWFGTMLSAVVLLGVVFLRFIVSALKNKKNRKKNRHR